MRKFITIVGVGERRRGISEKNKKSYDFTPIAFTYDMPYVSGVLAVTANISQDNLGDYIPTVGDRVEAVMHSDYTGKVYVDAIL